MRRSPLNHNFTIYILSPFLLVLTGLDAFQAHNVMESLWGLAQGGRSVVTTVRYCWVALHIGTAEWYHGVAPQHAMLGCRSTVQIPAWCKALRGSHAGPMPHAHMAEVPALLLCRSTSLALPSSRCGLRPWSLCMKSIITRVYPFATAAEER